MKGLYRISSLVLMVFFMAGCMSDSDSKVEQADEFNWQLVWQDDFESPDIDGEKWNFVEGAGGYGNNELQNYTSRTENVRIEDGSLIIEARKENYKSSPYTSAKVTTAGKGEWTYGRYEFRAKLPAGQGIWPAIWMMPADVDVYGGWPSCGEIDIMELVGHEADTVHGTLHYGMPWKYTGSSFVLEKGSFQEDFHIFALEWLPGEMRWYVDGQLFLVQDDWYSQKNNREAEYTFNAPFDRDFYIQLNVAVGGNWPGYPDDSTVFPQKMVVDWIRVYESAEGYGKVPVKLRKEETIQSGRAPQKNGNYVYNDLFDSVMDYWEFGNYEGGSGKASVVDGEMNIAIDVAGDQIWANQLIQNDMFIEEGKSYSVSFKGAAETPRKIMIKIGGLGDRGWAAYSGEQYIQIDSEMKTYTFDFTMEEKTDAHARYEFNMGLGDADIRIDNASLFLIGGEVGEINEIPSRKALNDGNLIYNGTFDQGNNRTEFWVIDSDSESDAFLSVSPEIYKREGHLSILDSSKMEKGIVLYQQGISIDANESYMLSFDAYARGNRKLSAALLDNGGEILYGPVDVDLTVESEHYSITFPVDRDFRDIRVAFLVADSDVKRDPDVILDNVSFVEVK